MENIIKIRKINEKQEPVVGKYFLLIAIALITLGVCSDSPKNIIDGFYQIIIQSDALITDYLAVGGLGATFINAGLIMLINFLVMRKIKLKINGFFIAGMLVTTGFAFFGNNILNVIPIYLGGYLYAKYQEEPFSRVYVVTIFATSLSPLVTEAYYMFDLADITKLIISILVGVGVGFIMPVLSSHMLKFHDGYNIYNVGLTAGIIGTVIIAIVRGYGYDITSRQVLSTEYDSILKLVSVVFFISLIYVGYKLNGKTFKGYRDLMHYSGRLVTDFVFLTGLGLTLINMGIMGLIGTVYVMMMGGVFNGPVMAGLFTLCGFSAFGNHPKNSIPVMIGVFIAALTKVWQMNSVGMVITGLFSTTLAPIAGVHGALIGVVAGFIHTSVVMNVGSVHGGINLYNNGFAGGIVASVLVPMIDAFKKENRK